MSRLRSHFDRLDLALGVSAAISAAPLFSVEHLPLTDLPEHAAVMASLAHWGDPAWRVDEHYVVAFRHSQYFLFHAVGALLTFIVRDAVLATRILVAATAVAFPFSLRALLRSLEKDERYALLACPLFWNRSLVIGFLPFVSSIPLLLYALALALRNPGDRSRTQTVGLAALAIVVFYVHVSGFVVLVACAVALAMARRPIGARQWGAWRSRVAELLWLGPAVGLAATWWAAGRLALGDDSLSEPGQIGRMGLYRSARALALWSHDIWTSHADEWCAAAFWLAFIALVGLGILRNARSAPSERSRALWLLDPASLIFLVGVALYFALPFRAGAAYAVSVRTAPIVALLAVTALPRTTSRWVWGPLAAVFLTNAATSVAAVREMRAMDARDVQGVDRLFSKMRTGSRLITLAFETGQFGTHIDPWLHLGSCHRVLDGGVASYSFTELDHWSLHYRPEAHPPKKNVPFWCFAPCVFRNAVDGRYYDYVLVRGKVDPFRDAPPGPVWRRVDAVKGFTLYEKTALPENPAWTVDDEGPCADRDALVKQARETRRRGGGKRRKP